MTLTLMKMCEILINPLCISNKHVLEFGVWKGDSLMGIRTILDHDFKIYGFDSFLGLPEDWPETGYKKGDFSLNGFVPDNLAKSDMKIFAGWFKDTIPEYLKEADDIALMHIDCDIYSSTIDILYSGIRKHIKQGTYIVFDDWHYLPIDRGESKDEGLHNQKAFKEWAKCYKVKYRLLNSIEPFRQAIEITKISAS